MKDHLKVLVFLKVLLLKDPGSKNGLSWHSQNGMYADFHMSSDFTENSVGKHLNGIGIHHSSSC